MAFFSFGEYIDGHNYKVLDERVVRAGSGIMLLIGAIASINGFILNKYEIIPWLVGFLAFNFAFSVFINPKYAPITLLARLMTFRQSSLPIGAVQKRFAWSLGLALSSTIFVLSLYLQNDVQYFEPVCFLCLICLLLLFLETAFGICVGCKMYWLTIKIGLLPKPKERPNCMGDACEIN